MSDQEKSGKGPGEELQEKAEKEGMATAWDRAKSLGAPCKFGATGMCCRNCFMGPCRIIEGKPGKDRGVCGATASTIAARNFLRTVCAGAAAHSDHGRAVAEAMVATAKGEAPGYEIKDEEKLHRVATEFGIEIEGRTKEEIAIDVGEAALADFGNQSGKLKFLARAPEARQKIWDKLNIAPRGIDREVTEGMHRSGMGSDQDYKNLLNHAFRVALGDGWGGSMIATELQDILFGTPKPVKGDVDLGVLKDDEVNIILHGHEPLLSEMIATASHEKDLLDAATKVGAKGINVAGICCTANELLMRHGIPVVGPMKIQELALSTGAIEAMVVDIQCVMEAVAEGPRYYHTKLITTSPKAKIPGAIHIELEEKTAFETAKKIVKEAIDNYPNRDKSKVNIPRKKHEAVVGFSHETIKYMLGGRFRASYRPLNDNIINGRIRGVAGVVGCTNPKFPPDSQPYTLLVKKLIANDILVVQTGCAAVECARAGLMVPEMKELAGPGLKEVCETVGMPPVLHAGSCVDNSRILVACAAMVAEGGLGNDMSDLPVAGACFEWMNEKAITIGHYFVASGVFTLFGIGSPVAGSADVMKYLTEEVEELTGGKWAFESDVDRMAELMIAHIEKKRDALGINEEVERKLYDMSDRRELVV